ncbi:MAG: hypothetical protein ACRDIV_23600 [Ktedonobacteraceae bacterium]
MAVSKLRLPLHKTCSILPFWESGIQDENWAYLLFYFGKVYGTIDFVVKHEHQVGNIEALVSLRHPETGKTAVQEKSDDFLDHPEIHSVRAVKRIPIS